MQSPSFNPFGGATRVSPPPPNASAVQNPYIGGPPGQTNAVQGTAGGFVSAAPVSMAPTVNGQVVGSGVQPAGFVGTSGNPVAQAGFPASNGTAMTASGGAAAIGYGTTAPANVNSFRAGGMQVNDLTRAPAPPGYPTPMQNNVAPIGPAAGQMGTPPVQPVFAPASAPIIPANGGAVPTNGGAAAGFAPSNGMTPIQPAQYQQPQAWQGTNAAPVPDAEIASRMVPVNTIPPSSTAPVTQSGTSPAPLQSGSGADSPDLMWRRPGS